MKHLKTVSLVALSLLLSLSGFAQVSGSDTVRQGIERKAPTGKGGNNQSRMLQHLLEMDDAQLSELRTTIERIQGMSPEEKTAMKQHLKTLNKMPREEVDAMRERFEAIPKEKRDEMRQRWQDMSPEERRALREKLRSLPPEERHEFMKESGIMPPRPKGPQQGDKNGKGPKGSRERPNKSTDES